MSQNLRDRLRRIQHGKRDEAAPVKKSAGKADRSPFDAGGWVSVGSYALKREVSAELPPDFPSEFSSALPLLVPDLRSLWGFSPNDKENAQFCAFSTLQTPKGAQKSGVFAVKGR
ncbi:MAG: hypothetical protein LBG57_01165, partial [Treponema sp.]|nr:hypothetical protein [Treponema sp.]